MKLLKLNKKTGFFNRGTSPVIILDNKGRIFYSCRWLTKPVRHFNLPKGEFFVKSGDIIKRKNPVKFRNKKLPPPERYWKQKRFKIKFAPNPNKATVYHDSGLIVFDPYFKDVPKFIFDFILYHEFGHQYYKTEHLADAYARNKMLKKGYNPSQIGLAPMIGLSAAQFDRKLILINDLT